MSRYLLSVAGIHKLGKSNDHCVEQPTPITCDYVMNISLTKAQQHLFSRMPRYYQEKRDNYQSVAMERSTHSLHLSLAKEHWGLQASNGERAFLGLT